MAYKLLVSTGRAALLQKKGESVEGFLTRAETGLGRWKSTIYHLQTKEGPKSIWGSRRIDEVLLDGKALRRELYGVMLRVTCTDVRTEKKGKTTKTYRDYTVEADMGNKLKTGGKEYILRK